MCTTENLAPSAVSARIYDLAWYAAAPTIKIWAEKHVISTYGQSEVFLAGINGAESCMRHRMSTREKALADVVYRLGQFAKMVADAKEGSVAQLGMIAAGKALRSIGAGVAAEKIYRAIMRGF